MSNPLLYPIGTTPACAYAAGILQKAGIPLTDHPTPEVTALLLDVPSFPPGSTLDLERKLSMLPESITVIGGNLRHPALEGYKLLDLLQWESYLCRNAAITADCALRVAAPLLSTTFAQSPTLIIGWGRIGKCLARLLQAMGTPVTVAARKESDRSILTALGYNAVDIPQIDPGAYKLIFNTAPEPVLDQAQLAPFPHVIKIDLASRPGLLGNDVHIARGLPGRFAPESSGRLIAQSILPRLLNP